MANYRQDLRDLAKDYNRALQQVKKKINQMEATKQYNTTYLKTEERKLSGEVAAQFEGKANQLYNKISAEVNKPAKEAINLDYPGIGTAEYEAAYTAAMTLMARVNNPIQLKEEARKALEMGREQFGFILLDEINRMDISKLSLTDQWALQRELTNIKQNHYSTQGKDYSKLIAEAKQTGDTFKDAEAVLNGIKEGAGYVFPLSQYKEFDSELKEYADEALVNVNVSLPERMMYKRVMENGTYQN